MKVRFRCIYCVIAAICCLACGDYMSTEDYSHAWRLAVRNYRNIDKDPSDPAAIQGGNGDGSQQAQAQAAGYISQQIRDVANSIKDLKAPPEFASLQEQTYLYYRGISDRYAGYSEAISSGDPDKMAKWADGLNTYATDQENNIEGIIKSLGDKASIFEPSWHGLMVDQK